MDNRWLVGLGIAGALVIGGLGLWVRRGATGPSVTPYGGGDKAVLSVSPQALDVTSPLTQNAAPQYVQVSNGGKGALKWEVGSVSPSWLSVTPTAGTNDQKLTVSFSNAGLPAGEHTASFQVQAPDQPTAPVNIRLVISGQPPAEEICGDEVDNDGDGQIDENPPCIPPPDPNQPRGPQALIACPAGAIAVSPGQNIQAAIDSGGAAAICLKPGTHVVTAPIRPRERMVLTGELGAIIDGKGVTSGDGGGTAIISGWNCTSCADVTVRNLVIKGQGNGSGIPSNCVGAYGNHAGGWTLDHNDISGCRWGINLGTSWQGTSPQTKVYVAGPTITANRITDHRGPSAQGESGAYGIANTTDTQFVNNEVASNGDYAKFVGTLRTRIAENHYHHNGRAIWFDGDNLEAVIENNDVDDQTIDGVFYEVSASGTIRNNRIRRSGASGLFISTSRQMDVSGNTFEDNWRDVNLFINCAAATPPGVQYPTAIGFDLKDVHVHDNTFRVGTRAETMAASWSYASTCNAEQIAKYKDPKAGQNNRFVNNTYAVPNISAALWFWDGWRTFSQWQAGGMDTTGTVTQR